MFLPALSRHWLSTVFQLFLFAGILVIVWTIKYHLGLIGMMAIEKVTRFTTDKDRQAACSQYSTVTTMFFCGCGAIP